jgi:HAD superfamily hydrolase (TIGR01549 family)
MARIIFPTIDLNNIKGVLIDIDNTLYSYDTAHQEAIKLCYLSSIETLDISLSFDDFYQKYRTKRVEITTRLSPQGACRSRLFAFQEWFEEIKIPQAFNKALYFEELYWDALIKNIKLDNGAEQFLKTCYQRNIKICALSDMQAHFQIKKLQALKVDSLIDYLVTSEEVGAEKPAKIMFETALRKLNLNSHEVIMIGDNEEKDIKGAEKLKIKSFLVEIIND